MRPDESASGLAQSKTCRIALAFCLLTSAFCVRAWGQSSIDWSTTDGGGDTSTGGVYSVTGTIGQTDAGTSIGGNCTVGGGFWGIIAALQTPGAPFLTITRSYSSMVVSRPSSAEGWLLYATTNLVIGGRTWTGIPPPDQTNGSTNISFIEPAPTGHKFYRLHRP
jgi:hypothetical protein